MILEVSRGKLSFKFPIKFSIHSRCKDLIGKQNGAASDCLLREKRSKGRRLDTGPGVSPSRLTSFDVGVPFGQRDAHLLWLGRGLIIRKFSCRSSYSLLSSVTSQSDVDRHTVNGWNGPEPRRMDWFWFHLASYQSHRGMLSEEFRGGLF